MEAVGSENLPGRLANAGVSLRSFGLRLACSWRRCCSLVSSSEGRDDETEDDVLAPLLEGGAATLVTLFLTGEPSTEEGTVEDVVVAVLSLAADSSSLVLVGDAVLLLSVLLDEDCSLSLASGS